MSITAKFICQSVTTYESAERVELCAAHGPGNESWSKATPGGNLQITISNPAARGQFTPGKSYMLTVGEAASAPPLAEEEVALMGRIVAQFRARKATGGEMHLAELAYLDHVGRLLLELPSGRGGFYAFLAEHGMEFIPADTFANTPSRIAPISTTKGPAITTTGNRA